ncbi:MAG: hypothetical protein ABIP48_31815 [Planctomycetota bacterium]
MNSWCSYDRRLAVCPRATLAALLGLLALLTAGLSRSVASADDEAMERLKILTRITAIPDPAEKLTIIEDPVEEIQAIQDPLKTLRNYLLNNPADEIPFHDSVGQGLPGTRKRSRRPLIPPAPLAFRRGLVPAGRFSYLGFRAARRAVFGSRCGYVGISGEVRDRAFPAGLLTL